MDTGIKVGDVMAKGIITISPTDSVKAACEIMYKHDLSGLTVVDATEVVGMLTQGDLVSMIANEENPAAVKVKDIMGKKLVSIGPEADIREAAKMMVENKVKRLPVLKGDKLIGVITQADIVRISPSVYDLMFDKAKMDTATLLEGAVGVSGECEECENFSEELRNVNGSLVCSECYEVIEE